MQRFESSNQTVLVTGSSGRVGAAVCRELIAQGWQVRGLDRTAGPFTQWRAEIDHAPTLRDALSGVSAVVHCAALHAPHVGVFTDAEFDRINVRATIQLAELALAAKVASLVFTSTTALYGRAAERADQCSWIDLDTTPEPETIYHFSKLQAELALAALAQTGDLNLSILRMSRCFPEPVDVMTVYRLHRGIDVRDVARAHVLALSVRPRQGFRRWLVSAPPVFRRADLVALGTRADDLIRVRVPELAAYFDRQGWRLPTHIDRVYDPSVALNAGWQSDHGWQEVLRQWAGAATEVLPPRFAV